MLLTLRMHETIRYALPPYAAADAPQKFGFELEGQIPTGNLASAVDGVLKALGKPASAYKPYESQPPFGEIVAIGGPPHWHLKGEGTCCPNRRRGFTGLELASPILRKHDVPKLVRVVRALHGAGMRPTYSAGSHVHLPIKTVEQAKRLILALGDCGDRQEELLSALHLGRGPWKERLRFNAHRIHADLVAAAKDASIDLQGLQDVQVKRGYDHCVQFRAEFGTVEFRLFNATMEPMKIRRYLGVVGAFERLTRNEQVERPEVGFWHRGLPGVR